LIEYALIILYIVEGDDALLATRLETSGALDVLHWRNGIFRARAFSARGDMGRWLQRYLTVEEIAYW